MKDKVTIHNYAIVHFYTYGNSAFTMRGEPIDTIQNAHKLAQLGVCPEFADATSSVCTVGYCPRYESWAGFSFKNPEDTINIFKFRIGDTGKTLRDAIKKARKGKIVVQIVSGIQSGFIARTPADCRLLACMFATAVE
jgi:hypothetical protein